MLDFILTFTWLAIYSSATTCYGNWFYWADPAATNYGTCTSCKTGFYEIAGNGSWIIWQDYCPSPQTSSGATCTGSLGTVFEAKFNDFERSWTYNGIILDSQSTTHPAKDRGNYFDGTGHMDFSNDFWLNFNFTFSFWLRQDTAGWAILYSSAEAGYSHRVLLILLASGKLKITYCDSSWKNAETLINPTSASTWAFIAFGAKLQTNATSITVNFKVNDVTDNTWTKDIRYFEENNLPNRVIGAKKSAAAAYSEFFVGFIYGVWIENVYQTGSRAQYHSGSWVCSDLCATQDGECLGNYDFTHFSASDPWDSSCSHGCVRAGICQTCAFEFCHLWADLECLSCTGYSATSCTDCGQNASLLGSGEWDCPHDRVDSNSSCLSCHSNWATCTNTSSNGCSTCTDVNAYASAGECICETGWYNSETNGYVLCLQCDAQCTTWVETSTSCTSWTDLNADITSVPGPWVCKSGYYKLPSSAFTCESWPQGCHTWDESGCNACVSWMTFNQSSGQWEMSWPEQTVQYNDNCEPCPTNCWTCINPTFCTACYQGVSLINGQCVTWTLPCTSWRNELTTCTQCVGDLIMKTYGTWECPETYQRLQTVEWKCYTDQEITISQQEDNKIRIELAWPIDNPLTADDISLQVSQEGSTVDVEYSLEQFSDVSYVIDIISTQDIPKGAQIVVNIESDFIDDNRLSLQELIPLITEVSIIATSQDSSDEELQEQESTDEATQSGSSGLVIATFVTSTITGDYAGFWRLINRLQLLMLMSFINITTTPLLAGFLGGLIKDSRIPNLYAYIGDYYDTSSMPNRFTTLRYTYPSFLDIFGHVMTLWIIIGTGSGLAMLTLLSKHPKISKIGAWVKSKMVYNGFIQLFMSSSIYIILGFMLNFRYGVNSTIISIINTTLGVLAFAGTAYFAYKILYWIIAFEDQIHTDLFKENYGVITQKIKVTQPLYGKIYSFLFLIRRIIIWGIIVFVGDWPVLQIASLLITNLAYYCWLIIARPFERRLINLAEGYIELALILVQISHSLFLLVPGYGDTIGLVIILICISTILTETVINIVHFANEISEWFKKRREKRRRAFIDSWMQTTNIVRDFQPMQNKWAQTRSEIDKTRIFSPSEKQTFRDFIEKDAETVKEFRKEHPTTMPQKPNSMETFREYIEKDAETVKEFTKNRPNTVHQEPDSPL